MPTISIVLPENLHVFFEAQLAELGLEGPEYIERLIREEKKRKVGEYYMKEIQKGIDSVERGDVLSAEEFWETLRERREKRLGAIAKVGAES